MKRLEFPDFDPKMMKKFARNVANILANSPSKIVICNSFNTFPLQCEFKIKMGYSESLFEIKFTSTEIQSLYFICYGTTIRIPGEYFEDQSSKIVSSLMKALDVYNKRDFKYIETKIKNFNVSAKKEIKD